MNVNKDPMSAWNLSAENDHVETPIARVIINDEEVQVLRKI